MINVLNESDRLLLILFNKIVLYNRQKTLQFLAAKGIDLNKCGEKGTILHIAAIEAKHAMITLLCCLLRVDINARDDNGDTALHLVTSFNNYEGVCILLEHEADVSLCNNKSLLPLDKAEDKSIRIRLHEAVCDQEVAKIFDCFGKDRAMKCQKFCSI